MTLISFFKIIQIHPTIINLTATLTRKSMGKIMKHLGIKKGDTFMIHRHPLNERTHLTIMSKQTDFYLAALYFYFENKLDKRRIIVFCTSLEDCGALYRDIVSTYPESTLAKSTQVVRWFIIFSISVETKEKSSCVRFSLEIKWFQRASCPI